MPDDSVSCARCGTMFARRPGRGRPRKYCLECEPRKRELEPLQTTLAVAVCSERGCGRAEKLVRGLCRKHYAQWWHRENPGYNDAWRDRNPGYQTRKAREWRDKNPERAREQAHRTYRKNRAACVMRSVARKRGLRRASAETLAYRMLLMADPCAYCGAPTTDIDHIDAVAQAGSNEWANLTASCRTCNARKGKRPLLEFLCLTRSSG